MQTPSSIQALFEQTPYEREFSASIVGISGNAIALDQTLFYPTGGGSQETPASSMLLMKQHFKSSILSGMA
ncbi:hypothetical protein [Pollutimonas bauzanensis]|uniref:Alanyl-tRNA synthetase n=1 Tax=Pollutimonas bauzanensis TaxID=658167 RepID=A0A1M5MSZ2_9BURK|nr:hypothetical protein [Pollutimonas bauzanensis]SHG80484.1 hypothetical protein SAMN04488135_101314 [Pollutimonas bauzanensis]